MHRVKPPGSFAGISRYPMVILRVPRIGDHLIVRWTDSDGYHRAPAIIVKVATHNVVARTDDGSL